jgi:hypothetical protein
MGGRGSGRQSAFDAKQTVEGCLTLDINKIARDKLLGQLFNSGTITWSNCHTGEKRATVGFSYSGGDNPTFTLIYTVTDRDGKKQDIRLPILLEKTYPRLGGERWWFTCPLMIRGRPCERRVGKLYKPPNSVYFGCRHCHDLTYESCQDSHKFDGLFRSIAHDTGFSPEAVKRCLKRL